MREPWPSIFSPTFLRSTAVAAALVVVAAVAAGEVSRQVAPGSARSQTRTPDATNSPSDPRLDGAVRVLTRGGFREAEEIARAALASDATSDRAAAILGIALSKQKRYTDARAWLERARDSTQAFPERRHAAHFLGWCCYHLGDLDAARAAFELHLKAVPDEPDSTFGLGLVALDEDRLDDAEKLFNAALARFRALGANGKPRGADEAKALTRLGDVALRRDDPAAAKRFLEAAVAASPVQHETWSKMARVCDRLGEHAAADAARANAERILESLGRRERPQAESPAAADGAPTPAATSDTLPSAPQSAPQSESPPKPSP
jgi:Tfp pilus assembly protein PilF